MGLLDVLGAMKVVEHLFGEVAVDSKCSTQGAVADLFLWVQKAVVDKQSSSTYSLSIVQHVGRKVFIVVVGHCVACNFCWIMSKNELMALVRVDATRKVAWQCLLPPSSFLNLSP